MRVVRVALGKRSYSIQIAPGMLDAVGPGCASLGLGRGCVVLTDSNVGPLYADRVLTSLRKAGFDPFLLTIPAGERSKNLSQVRRLLEQMAEAGLERGSFLVALGGGVVGDLGGFLAATYMRGIRFVQVPTSLLAQVDSSVGGKVGVNLRAGKNLVGAFYQPVAVFCDTATLRTLPERELRAGMSEVIKYGVIADGRLFRRLEQEIDRAMALEMDVLDEVIARCCAIKARVVARDEREGGLRAILNFGHTIGHALEAIAGYGRYLHGEAVAVGQVAAGWISSRLLGLPAKDAQRLERLLERAGLPTQVRWTEERLRRLLEAMRRDKKVQGGQVRFVLLRRLGKAEWGHTVSEEVIRWALMER